MVFAPKLVATATRRLMRGPKQLLFVAENDTTSNNDWFYKGTLTLFLFCHHPKNKVSVPL
jgi:hypothetical protein